jgi:rubrerythrin
VPCVRSVERAESSHDPGLAHSASLTPDPAEACRHSELAKTRALLKQAELGLQAAREREQTTARTYRAFAERARHELASCPGCGKPLRGSDLLVSGRCPNCEKALSSLLVPTRFGSLVQNEYLTLLGALGVLVGLAMATSAESAG